MCHNLVLYQIFQSRISEFFRSFVPTYFTFTRWWI
jgi:hypothetical protein